MAGVLTISQLRLAVLLLCVCVCVSEVVKQGPRAEEREGTCYKCMVISVEEVMELGHFYRPPTWTFTTTVKSKIKS